MSQHRIIHYYMSDELLHILFKLIKVPGGGFSGRGSWSTPPCQVHQKISYDVGSNDSDKRIHLMCFSIKQFMSLSFITLYLNIVVNQNILLPVQHFTRAQFKPILTRTAC